MTWLARQALYRRRRMVRGAVLALVLIVVVTPVLDRAAEVKTGTGGSTVLGLDLCAVPGVLLTELLLLSAEKSSRVAESRTLHVPASAVHAADHPPRSA